MPRIDKLWTGGRWAEGPAYFPAGKYLIWSDIPNDRLMRWDETSGHVSVFDQPCRNQNGHTVDPQGRLLACEHRGRCVSRIEPNGSRTILADSFDGKRLNSPNDLVVKSDGSIWFTDPSYGIDSEYEGDAAPSDIGSSNVYRIDPESGAVTLLIDDMVQPNGIAFSPDESILYVADTGRTHEPDCAAADPRLSGGRGRGLRRAAAPISSPATTGSSTASGSTPRAISGPRPATACTASPPTARSSARSCCRRWSPTSASAGRSGTGSSSAPPPRSSRSTSTPAAAASEETAMRQTWRWFGPKDPRLGRRHAAGRRRGRRLGPPPRPDRRRLDPRGDRPAPARDRARARTARPRASPGRWSRACRSPRTSRSRRAPGASTSTPTARACATSPTPGIEVVCYNFMPVLDWTRTDLAWRVAHGGTCMRFDFADFAAFDIHILAPHGRGRGLSRGGRARPPPALRRAWTTARRTELARNVVFGLPGSAQGITLEDVRGHLAEYGAISPDQLRAPLRRLPRGGGPDRRGGRHPHVLPPRRPALPAPRAAAGHVDRGRLRARSSTPSTARRTASPSAPARSARGPTTTCRR